VILRNASGELLAQNNDWRHSDLGGLIATDQVSEIEASGVAPSQDAESALIVTLDPGAYTAIVQGAAGQTGTAVVEIYDLDRSGGARLANISTRGVVNAGDDVLIGGVILGGNYSTYTLVRAIGPSLTTVPGTLADPTLSLYDANGSLQGFNDDWRTDDPDIPRTQAAPTNDKEAALLRLLRPGNYTAVVGGASNTTGQALVEFYAL
jgi:hypothetical protein